MLPLVKPEPPEVSVKEEFQIRVKSEPKVKKEPQDEPKKKPESASAAKTSQSGVLSPAVNMQSCLKTLFLSSGEPVIMDVADHPWVQKLLVQPPGIRFCSHVLAIACETRIRLGVFHPCVIQGSECCVKSTTGEGMTFRC